MSAYDREVSRCHDSSIQSQCSGSRAYRVTQARKRDQWLTETVEDSSQGVQLATIQALARYWDRLRLAQVRGEAERAAAVRDRDRWAGHSFIHVRSKHENTLPLIVTHGWPGSPIEQPRSSIR